MRTDDQSIWAKFISGDDEAYAYIYRQHIQKLFLYGMTFTSDEEVVKDCIQDVFVKIYKNRKRLAQTDNIRLYLTTALKNTLFNAFRKQSSYRNIISSIEPEEIDNDTAIERLMAKEKETEQEEIAAVCKSVLTQRQQEIIYYKFVEGLSLTEISDRLGIDYHSVANIIQRAFKKIRFFYHSRPIKTGFNSPEIGDNSPKDGTSSTGNKDMRVNATGFNSPNRASNSPKSGTSSTGNNDIKAYAAGF